MLAFKLANFDFTQSRFFWERVMFILDFARSLPALVYLSAMLPKIAFLDNLSVKDREMKLTLELWDDPSEVEPE